MIIDHVEELALLAHELKRRAKSYQESEKDYVDSHIHAYELGKAEQAIEDAKMIERIFDDYQERLNSIEIPWE